MLEQDRLLAKDLEEGIGKTCTEAEIFHFYKFSHILGTSSLRRSFMYFALIVMEKIAR